MNEIQVKIDRMISGNKDEILSGILSDRPIVVVNAIMSGTRLRITDPKFVEEIKKISSSSTEKVMGLPLSKFAAAALCILRSEQYDGEDKVIDNLVRSRFER